MRLSDLPSRLSAYARKAFGDEPFLSTDRACLDHQTAAFAKVGLDYAAARARLDAVLKDAGLPPFDEAGESQHWVLFAGLSLTRPDARRILEIGTFDGAFTRVLAALFPKARITTMDLADDDPIVAGMYGRHERSVLEAVVARRTANISRPGVDFVQKNSFFIPKLIAEPQDIIWIDGDHAFPALAWDFCNAYFALADGGVMACDDVYMSPGPVEGAKAHPKMLHEYLSGSGILRVDPILKRLRAGNSADPRHRKSVTVLRKP